MDDCEICKKCKQALKEKKEDALHYCLECQKKIKLNEDFKKSFGKKYNIE